MPINESQYIKSVSNYVIKEKRQNTNKGDIYERDITTIGGRNFYDKNKRPVYSSGNFVITASNEKTTPMPPSNTVWETPPNSNSEVWTWSDVEEINPETDSSIEIELKPDVYDLRTFAYYGSCSELIRASLNHIIDTFPGELYASSQPLIYLKDSGKETQEHCNLGNTGYQNLIENPFELNLHTQYVENYFIEKEPLKYLLVDSFYKDNYDFIVDRKDSNGNKVSETFYDITSITYTPNGDECIPPYTQMGTITVKYDNSKSTIRIDVWKLTGTDYAYLTNSSGWHIRPKEFYYNDFKNKLSIFEKTLLSENTLPKYSPYFEVLTESEYGFNSQMQQFTFPVDPDGKYNLDIESMAFSLYSGNLSDVGLFYDEYFCDNLYRSMTHEGITNFDWSYTREKDELATSKYTEGGTVMQKILRLIARKFDDIKLYIDGIKEANRLTYNGNSNLPDYLLTDYVENEGWEYKHIIPFVKKQLYKFTTGNNVSYNWDSNTSTSSTKELVTDRNAKPVYSYLEAEETVTPYNYQPMTDDCDKKDGFIKVKTHTNQAEYNSNDVNNLFSKLLALNSRAIWNKKGTIDSIVSLLSLFGLKNREWVEAINYERNKFDPSISCSDAKYSGSTNTNICPDREHYSTLDYKDKNGEWVTNSAYDYDIVEYTYQNISEKLSKNDRNYWVNINNNKYIGYNEDVEIGVTPTPWRGLLVKEKGPYTGSSKEVYYNIFPWFDPNAENDGKPYYQMYGGWLRKEVSLGDIVQVYDETYTSTDGTVSRVTKKNTTDDIIKVPYYTETVIKVRGVETIKDLMNLNKSILNDGDICYVSDLSRKYVLLDGIAYDLNNFEVNNKVIPDWYYIETSVINGQIVVGTKTYQDSINIIQPVLSGNTYVESSIIKPLTQYANNTNIRIFLKDNNSNGKVRFNLSDIHGNSVNHAIMISSNKLGFEITEDGERCSRNAGCSEDYETRLGTMTTDPTHYFILNNVKFANHLNMVNAKTNKNNLGWNQLSEQSPEYKFIKTIKKDYEGNNPHTHNVESDFGNTYIKYFANLFKHSFENNLINWDSLYATYGKTTDDLQSEFNNSIKNFGFSNLISEDNCTVKDPTPDPKLWVASKDKDGNYVLTINKNTTCDSDSIINTKIVEVKFYNCAKNSVNEKLKYFNDIILHYMAQVIPSTLIVKITYVQ